MIQTILRKCVVGVGQCLILAGMGINAWRRDYTTKNPTRIWEPLLKTPLSWSPRQKGGLARNFIFISTIVTGSWRFIENYHCKQHAPSSYKHYNLYKWEVFSNTVDTQKNWKHALVLSCLHFQHNVKGTELNKYWRAEKPATNTVHCS